ncbi:MAG: hypothetical protein C0501_15025 [Isosphaera sp.]|nr:hypothetical protein [Isosphaera sp.]
MKQPSQIELERLGLTEDTDAAMASVFWFDDELGARRLEQYRGMDVAILGEQIIDADRDGEAMFQRLKTRGDAINMNRVVIKHVAALTDAPLDG